MRKNDNKIKYMKIVAFVILLIVLLIFFGVKIKLLIENQSIGKNKIIENKIEEKSEEIVEDKGIFRDYYKKANQKLDELTIDEKIAQLFIIGNSINTDYSELEKYQFGGYLFFNDFFKEKTSIQVRNLMESYQESSKIPLLIAVDEEGGSVIRVSNNKNISNTPFKSPSELYKNGGFENIKQDTINKSNLLNSLGINLNFAPVVDIANNPSDYMYSRALQKDKDKTVIYSKTVIKASKGLGVSYTLKHFPGYGNNMDTHIGSSIDIRTYEEIYNNDLEPFRAGIQEGAESVMVSHNIVTSIDEKNQASISPKVHELLRNELEFKGIIITDALNMGAIRDEKTIEQAIEKAIIAGNDMIILTIDENTTDKDGSKVTYSRVINAVKKALNNGIIEEELINNAVTRILAWKYYKNLIFK